MSVAVRMAGPGDAALICGAHPDVFDAAPDRGLTDRFLAARHLRIALALDEGMTVGMCSGVIYHHPDKPPEWWINELGVAAPWRRRGLATRLVACCAAAAREEGCTGIWVVADPTEMAEGFWSSLGWDRTGERLAMFSCRLVRRGG